MHTIKTKSLHQYDHPEFEIVVDMARCSKQSLSDFLTHIQNIIADGGKLTEGTMIQFGTNLIKVSASDDDYLRFDEPNFKGLPITFIPNLTESIEAATRQRAFANSYGINEDDLNIPNMQDSGFVCSKYAESANLSLSRMAPTDENDSGWFFGSLDPESDHDNPENLSRISLYEILSIHPHLKPWLGFPDGTIIILDEDRVEVSLEGKLLNIIEGSELSMLS